MFTLDQVVPWGRSFDEYREMFTLSEGDLRGRILGCGDGPASFNAETARSGHRIVSCDPIYRFSAAQIRWRVEETYPVIIEQTRQNRDEFVWDRIRSVEELGSLRLNAMETFLGDYGPGGRQGRYIAAELPRLPFADDAFDLALCSHFLFLYSEQLTAAFHLESLIEMCRVAREARIFPLLALGSRPSPHVEPVAEALRQAGLAVTIEAVPYEFQRGGNQMMRVRVPFDGI